MEAVTGCNRCHGVTPSGVACRSAVVADAEPTGGVADRTCSIVCNPCVGRRADMSKRAPIIVALMSLLGSGVAIGRPIATRAVVETSEGTATRTYAASIVSGTGSYVGARGSMAIHLKLVVVHPPREYGMTMTLEGTQCAKRRRPPRRPCVRLLGSLGGSASGLPTPPDRPPRGIVSASGQVGPVGAVTAHGELVGTGFVATGTSTIFIVLTAKSGTLSIGGISGPIPGFRFP